MPGTIETTETHFILDFTYNSKLITAINSISKVEGQRIFYKGTDKKWFIPICYRDSVFEIQQRYKLTFQADQLPENFGEIKPLPELKIDIPLKWTLRPFQRNGVAYAIEKERLIIADQMGLGKTVQAIATIVAQHELNKDAFPCLVICPNSLKPNWKLEWELASHRKALIISDKVKKNYNMYYEAGVADVFIVNYQSLKKFFVRSIDPPPPGKKLTLSNVNFEPNVGVFKSIIVDESHRVKSIAAQQTKFTKGIARGKRYILLLTGTPVVNSPKDLVSQLGIINQMDAFGKYTKYMERYCSGSKGASNLKELNFKLNENCFYRRDIDAVIDDMPPKTREIVMCDITTRKEYNDALANLRKYLKEYRLQTDEQVTKSMRGEVMVRIGILKNISARGKMNEVAEFVEDCLENGEKLVVFARLHEVFDAFHKKFSDCRFITGRQNQVQIEEAKNDFQKCKKCGIRFDKHDQETHDFIPSDTNLIGLNYDSAAEGHTLTAARKTANIEIPWTSTACDQCEARVHRMTQKNAVTCTYFLGINTIDEWLYEIVRNKREIGDAIVGNESKVQEMILNKFLTEFELE